MSYPHVIVQNEMEEVFSLVPYLVVPSDIIHWLSSGSFILLPIFQKEHCAWTGKQQKDLLLFLFQTWVAYQDIRLMQQA